MKPVSSSSKRAATFFPDHKHLCGFPNPSGHAVLAITESFSHDQASAGGGGSDRIRIHISAAPSNYSEMDAFFSSNAQSEPPNISPESKKAIRRWPFFSTPTPIIRFDAAWVT